jgi:hypothetical protein
MSSLISVEEWLGNNLPEVLSDLNPGVTEDELRAFAVPNMALNLAPFSRWTLRNKAAQRRLALR